MTDEDAKIRDKIEKLKRLAHNNGNFNEMTAALAKAKELEDKLAELEWQRESEVLEGVKAIADRHYGIADRLMEVVNKCRIRRSTKGIDEMVAYSFNAQGIEARYGGSGGLPAGKHPVTITKTEAKPTKDNTGGYIEFTLTAFDGPAKGGSMADRLNVHNTSQEAVRIANQQMAAYCAVTGVFHFQNTDELIGKPFVIEVAPQKNDPRYMEIVALFDMNGNEPGKAGAGPMQGGAPNGGFPNQGGQPQGGGFPNQGGGAATGFPAGGSPAPDNGGQAWGQQPQGGQQQPPANQGGGQPGWGGQGGGAPAGGQPQGGQPQGGGWQQNGGQPGGQPGWGQR